MNFVSGYFVPGNYQISNNVELRKMHSFIQPRLSSYINHHWKFEDNILNPIEFQPFKTV